MNYQPEVSDRQASLRYSWYVVAILTLANISSFLDRQILALLIRLGLGPYVVAVVTDIVFKDEMAIRFSLVVLYIIGGSAALLFYLIGQRGYSLVVRRRSVI